MLSSARMALATLLLIIFRAETSTADDQVKCQRQVKKNQNKKEKQTNKNNNNANYTTVLVQYFLNFQFLQTIFRVKCVTILCSFINIFKISILIES